MSDQPLRSLDRCNDVLTGYGLLMVAWSSLELTVEVAIGKALGITHAQTSIITSTMQFRQRANVLAALLQEAKAKDADEAIALLMDMEQSARRNALVHGHVANTAPGKLSFFKAAIAPRYSVKRHDFDAKGLSEHLVRFAEKVVKLQSLLGIQEQDYHDYAEVQIAVAAPKRKPHFRDQATRSPGTT